MDWYFPGKSYQGQFEDLNRFHSMIHDTREFSENFLFIFYGSLLLYRRIMSRQTRQTLFKIATYFIHLIFQLSFKLDTYFGSSEHVPGKMY